MIRQTDSWPARSASRGSARSTCRPAPRGRVTSVALEKFQVSLLAERLEELLDEVLRRTGGLTSVPAATPADLTDDEPLDLPLMEDFRVGAIALAWDGEDERVVIEAQEESETPVEPLADDVPENGPDVLRVRITARPARGRSPSVRCASSARAGRRARCAACRWTPKGTSARGRTATGPPMAESRRLRGSRPPPRVTRVPRVTGASPGHQPDDHAAALELLAQGDLEVEGRLVVASNATLYCTIRGGGTEAACVYKPVAGERPLWDFPHGTLAGREVAAYAVSRAAGWNLVPPTVYRDGPFGPGMCQLWIDADAGGGPGRAVPQRGPPGAARHGRVRRGGEQRRPQDRPPAAGQRRPAVRLRSWRLLRRGVQAAHRAVAVARPQAARPGAGRAGPAQDRTGHRVAGRRAAAAADRGGDNRHQAAGGPAAEAGVHPYPPEDWPAVPWPPY